VGAGVSLTRRRRYGRCPRGGGEAEPDARRSADL